MKVPRDRNGEYEPQIIGKYSRNADGIEEKILGLYVAPKKYSTITQSNQPAGEETSLFFLTARCASLTQRIQWILDTHKGRRNPDKWEKGKRCRRPPGKNYYGVIIKRVTGQCKSPP